MQTQMMPPWIRYPAIPRGSIGWRMGEGEAYLEAYDVWLNSLSADERREHHLLFPEPRCWSLEEACLLRHGSFWIYRWTQDGEPSWTPECLAGREFLPFWGHQQTGVRIQKSCLSQWYPSSFQVDVVRYSCMEQYMMAMKARLFDDRAAEQEIMAAAQPGKIKALGRGVQGFDEATWDRFKYAVVCTGNYYKFVQNESLRHFLLKTGDAVLVEASPYDTVWGIGLEAHHPDVGDPTHWRGKNLLGFALMEVREEIRRVWQNAGLAAK